MLVSYLLVGVLKSRVHSFIIALLYALALSTPPPVRSFEIKEISRKTAMARTLERNSQKIDFSSQQ